MPIYRFVGRHGSCGLKFGTEYLLEHVDVVSGRGINVRIHKPNGSTLLCPYSSRKAFDANWTRLDVCEHPSISKYQLGCRCKRCKEARRVYTAQYRAQHAPRTVPAGNFADRIDWLVSQGLLISTIAAITGITEPTLRKRRQAKRLHRKTAERLAKAWPDLVEAAKKGIR